MTPVQVSELSETEINRAMIWLYPVKKLWGETSDGSVYIESGIMLTRLDYLSDWNLTMPLAFKAQLNIDFINNEGFESCDAVLNDWLASQDANPLRAICEVLILIALNK